jgi:TonB family protein
MASSVTRYAVRETNVRQRPTTSSPVVGKLARGASVMGVVVPGVDPEHRWFKITSGDFTGYFVSADANVSDMARPSLDTSFAGGKAVYRYAALYAEPDRASRILEYAKPGTTLSVVGAVSDGLAEVSLRSGAIAYVEQTAFEAPADAEEDYNEAPAEVSSKDSTSSPRFVDLSRPASLQNRDFISASDYPAKSLRENDTGTVGFRVEVSAQGFPGKCRVIRSSGHERLDRATCRLVEERARFDPARDVSGEPMPGLYVGSFTWRLD